MEITKNIKQTKIELEKEEKIIITHKGSVWQLEIIVDEYDDLICFFV